jgi:hypothetical protein
MRGGKVRAADGGPHGDSIPPTKNVVRRKGIVLPNIVGANDPFLVCRNDDLDWTNDSNIRKRDHRRNITNCALRARKARRLPNELVKTSMVSLAVTRIAFLDIVPLFNGMEANGADRFHPEQR